MTNKPLISLIIAVYNKPNFLEKIFYSLANQKFTNFEILIADDGSTNEIKQVIKKHRPRFTFQIQHVWQPDNDFRKTIIINKTIEQVQGDYLVFIDGDCILHHLFLKQHYNHRKRKRILAGRRIMLDSKLTDKIKNYQIADRTIEKPSFWWNNSKNKSRKHGFFLPMLYYIKNIFKNNYSIVGCNFSVHKEDFIAINGYDESIIGRGMEDDNLTARFLKAGMQIQSVAPIALQYHLYHTFKPVPHSKETIKMYANPDGFWTNNGLKKKA